MAMTSLAATMTKRYHASQGGSVTNIGGLRNAKNRPFAASASAETYPTRRLVAARTWSRMTHNVTSQHDGGRQDI